MKELALDSDFKVRYSVRLPKALNARFKLAGVLLGKSGTALFEEAIGEFLERQPWRNGLEWEVTHAVPSVHNGFSGDDGFMQVGLYLPESLLMAVNHVLDKLYAQNVLVSKSAFIYTAALWWAREQKFPDVPPPPPDMARERRRLNKRSGG